MKLKTRAKRKFKRLTNPFYGKKGMGWINNPKKAFSNMARKNTKAAVNGAMGCLIACCWYPMYWTFILMWWMIKYIFLGMWWLGVAIVNGVIALIEWIMNLSATENSPAQEVDPTKEVNTNQKEE